MAASEEDLKKALTGFPDQELEKLRGALVAVAGEAAEQNSDGAGGTAEAAESSAAAKAELQADTGATAAEAAAEAPAPQAEEPPVHVESSQLAKIHSAIRWGKASEDIASVVNAAGISMSQAIAAKDEKNGNRCLHIAAQNGYLTLVKFLVENKANVNVQNGKGQTPLHMSIEYDFYYQSKFLLDAGADPKLANVDGHEALTGLEGSKTGKDAWDNPVAILKASGDNFEEIQFAFKTLEGADASLIDKASLVQAGMAKKKTCKENWDAKRFMAIVQKID